MRGVDVHVSLDGCGDLSVRIYRQLLEAVLDGRLRAGERLPPSRELAARLDVSRNTVTVAYERLAAEGYLAGRIGSGTFVSNEGGGQVRARRAPAGAVRPRPLWESLTVPASSLPGTPVYDFRIGIPDATLFPLATWRRFVARELRPAALRSADYGEPAGTAGLRAAIARHVGVSRAVRAGADDVIVTQGAQQAVDLIGRVLIEPGACVAVEEPGYLPVRRLFQSLGARVVGVPVDGEGLQVAALPKTASLVYVTPSHQFPLGMPMSLQRRTAVLSWAERSNAVVIEDDYDSEFRFAGRPLDSLQSLDRHGRVVYVGSFSKVMLPALRLGFLVAPASLQPTLRAAKQLADWHGELPTQAALARFIDEGLLARHIRKVTREYAIRRERIAAVLQRRFRAWLELVSSVAGLHLAAGVASERSVDMNRVVRRAHTSGVAVYDLRRFYHDGPGNAGLVIGYGAIPTARIDEGLKRLATAFRG